MMPVQVESRSCRLRVQHVTDPQLQLETNDFHPVRNNPHTTVPSIYSVHLENNSFIQSLASTHCFVILMREQPTRLIEEVKK